MKINNNNVVCFKVFISSRMFICGMLDTETNHTKQIEISNDTPSNEDYIVETLHTLVKCFSYSKYIFCGYNNNHFDNAFINMIFDKLSFYKNAGVDNDFILKDFNDLKTLILGDDIEPWKKYKYGNNFKSFDLMTMNFTKKERVSLSELKFSLGMDSIEGSSDAVLNESIRSCIVNDLEAIRLLLNRSEKKIAYRININEKLNIGTLSLDDISLARKMFNMKYTEKTGCSISELAQKPTADSVNISDIILPFIKFKTDYLNNFLNKIKSKSISFTKPELEERFHCFCSDLSFGLGGIHSIETPKIYTSDESNCIVSIDAESMYPHFIVKHNIYPEFFGEDFVTIYHEFLKERIVAKHTGDIEKDNSLKRFLVSIVGSFKNPNDPLYSPENFYKITINSQLILLMLAERLYDKFCINFIQWNTDGLFIKIRRNESFMMERIIDDFYTETKISFKVKYHESIYQLDVNNYFTTLAGWNIKNNNNNELIKYKGMFDNNKKNYKAVNASVITKAVIAFFLFNRPVDKTIRSTTNLNEFMFYSKVPAGTGVYYGNTKVSNTNRYYYSTNGFSLNKKDQFAQTATLISDLNKPVTLFNNSRVITNIDYGYYISKAKALISRLQFVQLKMF